MNLANLQGTILNILLGGRNTFNAVKKLASSKQEKIELIGEILIPAYITIFKNLGNASKSKISIDYDFGYTTLISIKIEF